MSAVVVLGAGMNGLAAAMVLAKDGHEVTVLERDAAAPPDGPDAAWKSWDRRGVNQFRQLHLMLPRWRAQMEAELPEVLAELERWGALRINLVTAQPESRTGGRREGDDLFDTVTARRPVLEAVLATVAERTPGVAVRRGVTVTGLVVRGGGDVPHVEGVRTAEGAVVRCDLVVDACGRRSSLPAWLEAVGAAPLREEREDCGFIYYGRYLRSPDGSLPELRTPALVTYNSVSVLALPADHGTWGVGLVVSSRDRALRRLRETDVWDRVLALFPHQAHWRDGEPISDGVDVMAGIEDRIRTFVVEGRPVATGVVAVGDSWACTNPSLGRGTSIGLLHILLLRDLLRAVGLGDPTDLVRRFDEATRAEVEPLYRATLAFDRHRLAEIEADVDGRRYEPDDPGWAISKALAFGARDDPDLLRCYATIASLQGSAQDVLARPGVFERVVEVGADMPRYAYPGPDRARLLAAVGD